MWLAFVEDLRFRGPHWSLGVIAWAIVGSGAVCAGRLGWLAWKAFG